MKPEAGTVKLTDLWTYSEICPLPKWLIPHTDDDRIRLHNPRFPFNLTVPQCGHNGRIFSKER